MQIKITRAKPWWMLNARFPFHAEMKNFIKGIPGARWEPVSKGWLFPAECLPIVQAQSEEFGIKVISAVEPRQAPTEPQGFSDWGLYPFQFEGVRKAANAGWRWLFNDEMGLGKTAQAILTLRWLGITNAVIVCPAIVRLSWEREFDKWWPDHPGIGVISYGKSRMSGLSKKAAAERDEAYAAPIKVVSYSLLEHLRGLPFSAVIFDEAHRLKNPASKQSKLAREFVLNCGATCVLGCTATLLPDRPTDVWNVLDTVWPGRAGKLDSNGSKCTSFNMRYSVGTHNGYGWSYAGINEAHKDELRQRLAAFSSRTTKEDVAHLLPPYDVQPLFVRGGEKLDHVIDWVEDAREGGTHICILTHLRKTAAEIAHVLTNRGHKGVAIIDGAKFPQADARNRYIEELKQNPECILVATMHSLGIGIDLTKFTQSLFAELYWRPETIIQALGRFSRLSGKVPSSVKLLVREGTQDEIVASALQNKVEAINEAIRAGKTEGELEEVLLGSMDSDDAFLQSLALEHEDLLSEEF